MNRILLAGAAGILISLQVIRNASVAAFAEQSPDTAARIWPDHPSVQISKGLTQIAAAARHGAAVPGSALDALSRAARKAPLAAEPFLVRGVQAQVAGKNRDALAAFLAAERRDPRSLAAHYFLAEHDFRAGNSTRGLAEAAALARLAPGGVTSAAPYLAAYAKQRPAWPRLRQVLDQNPDLAAATLDVLAQDAANADAITALAGPQQRTAGSAWVQPLLLKLIDARRYDRAYAIWLSVSGRQQPSDQPLHDADFMDSASPPPFNWQLTSSSVGSAERQPGGHLHVMFYGQQDGLLARQLLLLRPGPYRVSMRVAGKTGASGSLNWSLKCNSVETPFAAISLDVAATRPWRFDVPAGCDAQWLELSGVSSDVAQQVDVTIGQLQLTADRSND